MKTQINKQSMGTTGQSITLANSIIGVGILAMPFCFQQCGVLLAGLILLSMGLVSRLCCHFLLKSAIIARRRNFEFLAFHVFGSAGKLAVELGIIGFLMGTCIAYFVVVGDLGPQIVAKMFNINQSDILRTSIMVIVSLVCVLPLGLLRNVDSLGNVSAATIGFYLCLVVKVLSEAASQLPSGEWQHKMELWKPSGVLQCVPILSMALFCQTQLFEIFESHQSLSLEKMNVVTKNALNICTCVYFTLGVFGYMAFCSQQISGNILMSLSPTMASDVIKLGFVMSLAFSFPLIIFPCRASIYSLLYKKFHVSQHDNIINHSIPESTFRCITAGIVSVTLVVSLLIPDIELVLGLVGSTIGVLVCVVFPSACFLKVTFKDTNERLLAKAVLVLGLIIMVLGTYANLQAAEVKLDKYDERYITQERIDKIVEDFFEKRGEKLEIKNEPYMKPLPNKDPSKAILKDSEVQPPNPVPPESNSNEIKNQDVVNGININNNNNKNINEVLLPEKIKEDEAADKVSESHPKNLKTKLEAKVANGNTEIKTPEKSDFKANEEIKDEKINLKKQQQLIETMKQHGEEQKELMQEQNEIMAEIIQNKKDEKPKEPSPETKPEYPKNKEQQLLETLEQHGKEQKDILSEIIKTKKEFEENKKVNSNEAQKIAVESIKQIADMAIKSIGGVTEKPVAQNDDKKAEHLEQIANAAVQQIAKKAVETIEAIKEIKQSPDTNPKREVNLLEIIEQDINKNIEAKKPSPQQVVDYVNKPIDIKPNVNIAPKLNNNNDKAYGKPLDIQTNEKALVANDNKNKAPQEINNIADIEKHNSDLNSKNENQQPTNSHSPSKPQTFKGEAQIDDKSNKNLHLPILKELQTLETVKQYLQAVKTKKEAEANIPRHKREVVDCTKTLSLDPVDRKICKSLLSPDFNKNDVLPKVDLNKAFRPLDPLHHIGRSLKTYDENKDGY